MSAVVWSELTPAERSDRGREARRAAPRTSHAEWEPGSDRTAAVEILARQAATRVPELVPLRYERMLDSPFAFYRGAAAIMAADLASTPHSGFDVQLCGDAHLSNFGAYAAPDRALVFDLNDFDETLPGPWEWDLKRLAASFEIATRSRGLDPAMRERIVATAVRGYREEIRRTAGLSNLDVRYLREDVDNLRARWQVGATRSEIKGFDRQIERTRRKDRMRAFAKLTRRVDGRLRIISDPPLIVPIEDLFEGEEEREMVELGITRLFENYRETLARHDRHLLEGYRYVHAARKVVGVGSVGTRAWIALFVGRDEGDPLFLQIKEAQPSVLEPFLEPSEFGHQGQRVVEGQRIIQATIDIMLGWLSTTDFDGNDRQYYVRQLWDQKGSVDTEVLAPRGFELYSELCGITLARAHARSGDRIGIAGYLGKSEVFDRALCRFARIYADQNEQDYESVRDAGDVEYLAALRY